VCVGGGGRGLGGVGGARVSWAAAAWFSHLISFPGPQWVAPRAAREGAAHGARGGARA